MGNELAKAAVASGQFWTQPEVKKIGKISHPSIKYSVGEMYRGTKSIITADELNASIKILKAYRNYKRRKSAGLRT
jgi:hypothetical protein